MSGKKKNSRKNSHTTEKIVLATAVLELVETLLELIRRLIE